MAKKHREPRELTVRQAAGDMRRGKLTAAELIGSCLERIEVREGKVKAWVSLYGEEALELARKLDRQARRGAWAGPLHGIPVGIKDIIHVAGMKTTGGTGAYPAHVAGADADCVARLRAAGAIVLGKTVTTAFAYADAGKTRNPWDLTRTPGGSSSGSGAAVGDRMCLAALGTQTGGSTLRPGAFNGIPAFKASFGEVPTGGVLPLSWTFDHVGPIGRDVADLHLLWEVMRQPPASQPTGRKGLPPAPAPRPPERLWRLRGTFEEHSDPEVRAGLDAVCKALRKAGVKIVEQALPPEFEGIYECWKVICYSEAASHHRKPFAKRKKRYPPRFTGLMEEGLAIPAVDYLDAMEHRRRFREAMLARMPKADAMLLPTAPTPPPDPSTTGDPTFLSPWTLCGLPALSLPSGLTSGGLPLAIQLVAPPGEDTRLLQMGRWCENLLAFDAVPG